MTPITLTQSLAELGWSQAELSRRLGVHVNTVSAWATGKDKLPRYAEEYLRVQRLNKDALR